MTILGAVARPDQAFVWTDSEVFRGDGTHLHYRNKLTANAHAGAVCLTRGWLALAEEADKAFRGARDVDEAAAILPKRLRERALTMVGRGNHDPAKIGGTLVLLVGFSPLAGRIVAYELSGAAMFEPVMMVRVCAPAVPGFDELHEPDPTAIVAVAQSQMDVLREGLPGATGGRLVGAVVRPGGVEVASLYDLTAGRWLLPAMAPAQLTVERE